MSKRVWLIFSFVMPILILGYSNCAPEPDFTKNTSTIGNPVVEFSFGAFTPPPSFQNPIVCVDSIEAVGFQTLQIDVSNIAVTINPSGTTAFEVELPRGTYTAFNLILTDQCGAGKSAQITNVQGSFSTNQTLKLRYTGYGVAIHSSLVTLETQNLIDVLAAVASEQDLVTDAPAVQNRFSMQASACPMGFALVSADSFYPATFCVAKFEAKNAGGVAVSQPAGTPWINISRTAAIAACQANGAKFNLISNEQWQAIARQIEANPSNWSGAGVGYGKLSIGHCDNIPSNPLSASDVSDAWDQTGNSSAQLVGFGWEQKRWHYLSNGENVWDIGGNVHEWVAGDHYATGFPQPLPGGTFEYTDTAHFPLTDTLNRRVLGPFNSGFDTSYSVGNVFNTGAALPGLNRGSNFMVLNARAGIFSAGVGADPNVGFPTMGFRCVYSLP